MWSAFLLIGYTSVVLWPSQPSRFIPGPLPSSAGMHCGDSSRLETKAWRSQTIVAQNGGDRPASTESWPGDGKATHAGQSGMAATRGNGNVDLDKLLKRGVTLSDAILLRSFFRALMLLVTDRRQNAERKGIWPVTTRSTPTISSSRLSQNLIQFLD